MSASEILSAGMTAAVSLAILPLLSSLIIFNVSDKLGFKRIITRIIFFSAGVIFAFLLSVWVISAAPEFFITNSQKLDIIWALIIFYIGYIVIKSKNVFVMRAARDMFTSWCYGTFMIGTCVGSIWVNYLSMREPTINTVFGAAAFAANSPTFWPIMSDALLYSLGLVAVVALVGLITYVVSNPFKNFLAKQRMNVKLICGLIIVFFSVYIIFADIFFILTSSKLPF